jgi:hypothetical protein
MMTGVYAAGNIMGETNDVWAVNTEKEYHEEGRGAQSKAGDRMVPTRVQVNVENALSGDEEEIIEFVFARLDPVALGVAVGTVMGLVIFMATLVLVLKGGSVVGPGLALLGNYLIGFEVTWSGSLVGLVEGGLGGFAIGYVSASLRNWGMTTYAHYMRWRGEVIRRRNLLDKV